MAEEKLDIGNYWKTIADMLQDGLLIFDTQGKFVAANAAVEKLTGYTEDDLKDKDCRILNCTGCKIFDGREKKVWCMLFSRGHVRDKNCSITHKDGRTVHFLKSGAVLRGQHDDARGCAGRTQTQAVDQRGHAERIGITERARDALEAVTVAVGLDHGHYLGLAGAFAHTREVAAQGAQMDRRERRAAHLSENLSGFGAGCANVARMRVGSRPEFTSGRATRKSRHGRPIFCIMDNGCRGIRTPCSRTASNGRGR
ncbi:MAG: PAS domain S-box protein [Desulfobacteraceae bacterium]|nr:PAS domain S-box protein [Desulfobacteraceae bacterium]